MAAANIDKRKMREYNNKWDRENMRSLTCRVRTEQADIFKQYCAAHNTTPGNLLKKYVFKCIEDYGVELEESEKNK